MALRLRPSLFICDIQERFVPHIYGYSDVIATAQRMLTAAKILDMPVYVSTQNRAKLGNTVNELNVSKAVVNTDKSRFSMMVPEISNNLHRNSTVAITGIETQVCVLQTTLDLLKRGHTVYLLSDGISSVTKQQHRIALHRLAHQGAIVTTSESFLFEVMGDSEHDKFKAISNLIKETRQQNQDAVDNLM